MEPFPVGPNGSNQRNSLPGSSAFPALQPLLGGINEVLPLALGKE